MIEDFVLIISKLIATPVLAQSDNWPPKLIDLAEPFQDIFDLILPVGALIAVGMLIYGGYMWIISGGDPSKKQVAQGTLTWSIIGLVFLFLIKAILTLLLDFLGA